MVEQTVTGAVPGVDPAELEEWFESLDDLIIRYGKERVKNVLAILQERAYRQGVTMPFTANTPYINTIPVDEQTPFPGNREIERRIKSIIRWNAMAMVVRANKYHDGIGGHISTYASAATLCEVGFNHFFHSRTEDHSGDVVYFQGHASPGVYARAFVEGRLTEENLERFRQEIPRGGGLSSYPHPWLMPNFWQFPTVSMGLGPIMSIYHARFLRYLHNRGIMDTSKSKVWCFVGDGETDEPETLGAITLASREHLDNLIFVINRNLQRLDGPVRGNGKIIQELEAAFRGAGWNCIKVVWGSDWDPLLAEDEDGHLVKRMGEVIDGQYQKYVVEPGSYIREHFFGENPELAKMAEHLSDDQLKRMKRGGHDPEKVYAAYNAAVNHTGSPTVILAKTIKGYGLGEIGEGRNIAHNVKKANEEELRDFRSRFGIPIRDEDVKDTPFYKPDENSPEMQYLQKKREELGGYLPKRTPTEERLETPSLESLDKFLTSMAGKKGSTTGAFGILLGNLLRDKVIGKRIVPIIPDEARTFGMEGLFKQCGIYASQGQLYEPVDRDQLMYYKEAKDGQILEEGINEAGAISSFIAAGTAYANQGVNMIPFYVYYSMFGFQRVGDLVWAAADSRTKGFMLGGTSGRTTLNGEGLQHQDGHSHVMASTVPTLLAYDPAYAYELAVIIQEGLRRMYQEGEEIFYYLSVYNENYEMAPIPEGEDVVDGIIKGIYKFRSQEVEKPAVEMRPQLFGSGPILREVLRAQEILAEKFNIATDVWSVTSYNQLARNVKDIERENRLHPDAEPQKSYLDTLFEGVAGPFIASSDNIKLVADQIREDIPGNYCVLGTDGFGRSETRESLRRHFEIDAENVVVATLVSLAEEGQFDKSKLPAIIKDLGIDPEKVNPRLA
ncbi:MAG: pyruvate dehydrogenase (acetyl-transferring), homodimeric type [Gimesia sp.]|uniref:pyruvate dehydrogenase (acetyl-transferring), homodimeric type n=1 Tax=Gimesia sp. TaxID=2024833 RepID=UPI000C3E12BE|nr:pyruvate dehydrogenase (acetyl-transferring), homodimeric type [Gimesia sp.]MAX37278.1 pyruvate dehydrogenase (acetyl-transferring), homodimeric type [Gimesia sp.]